MSNRTSKTMACDCPVSRHPGHQVYHSADCHVVSLVGAHRMIERLTRDVAARDASIRRCADDAVACWQVERDRLRALLREWLAGCPAPPEWHWSFQLNIRTVNELGGTPDETNADLPCDKCGHGVDEHVGVGMPCPTGTGGGT